jgi:16S rRNA (cytosine1402-N4)-methyltransferase
VSAFVHETVLADEAVDALRITPSGRYVDCTAGGGGHSVRIAARLGPGGVLLALDRDEAAVVAARSRLDAVAPAARVAVVHAPFSQLVDVARDHGLAGGTIDGILADLGVSSPQLEAGRGFSFQSDDPLDMRMDPSGGPTASEWLDQHSETEIADVLYRHGDERLSRRIARAIVAERPIRTTGQLAALVARVHGGRKERIHPATRTFQALRIVLNAEDSELDTLLDAAFALLRAGGRLAIITFHSGEDRAVKHRFQALAKPCVCPPELPVCVCLRRAIATLPYPRGIEPSDAEVARNPRARSARLRVAEKLAA